MWRFPGIVFVVCVVCLIFAQKSDANLLLRVIENETRLEIKDDETNLSLVVENPAREAKTKVKLEMLTPDGKTVFNSETFQELKTGKQTLEIPLSLSPDEPKSREFLWYRLHYEVAPENSDISTADGIISISQLLPEIFELEMFTNQAVENSRYSIRLQTTNPGSEKAVGNVDITGEIAIEDGEILKAAARTDNNGAAVLEFNLPRISEDKDLNLKVTGSKHGVTREIEKELSVDSLRTAYIQTDKPLYQPNQTFNMRLYYMDLLHRPLPNSELEITIENEDEDSEDETVFKDKVTTSRFGIANITWKIPESARLGKYRIRVRDDGDQTIGEDWIKITRYDVPLFDVEAKPDRKFYLPEQRTAKVEINASYLFGKPVTASKIRVVPQSGRYGDEDEKAEEITGEADEQGKFTAQIDLTNLHKNFTPDRWKLFQDFPFSVYVTDPTTNKTEQKRLDLRITKEPIHVYLIGDTSGQSQQLPLKYYVSTFYADGTPATCEVNVYERIDKDLDGEPIPAELGQLLAGVKTNSYGVARLALPLQIKNTEDEVKLKLVAQDKIKQTGSAESDIKVDSDQTIQVETDKTVYRKGAPIRVSLLSSKRKGKVFVEVKNKYGVLQNVQTMLENGQARVTVPYNGNFKNEVTVSAFFEDEYDNIVFGEKSVVYPTPQNLQIDSKIKDKEYRPGENASIKFQTRTGEKKAAETALGVLVLDKAIEARARTESEFGQRDEFLNRNFYSNLTDLLGLRPGLAGLTRQGVENLNLSKPISPDLELAIEIAYGNGSRSESSKPELIKSESLRDDVDRIYDPFFKKQLEPVSQSLTRLYNEQGLFPTDENSLREILRSQNIELSDLRDPWGNPYQVEFRFDRKNQRLDLWTPGADKTPKTADDLSVMEMNWPYFEPTGKILSRAALEYNQTTGNFITDYPTLRAEMRRQNIDPDKLRDPWGNPYRFEFSISRTNYLLSIKTNGANGKAEAIGAYPSDDAEVWSISADYFSVTKAKINELFDKYVTEKKTLPKDEAELKTILRENGFNLDELQDAYRRPYYIRKKESYRLARFYQTGDNKLKAVKQLLVTFSIKSAGRDGIEGNYDDFELISFNGASQEKEVPVNEAERDFGNSNVRRVFRQSAVSTTESAIGGTVFDMTGAVIPTATATVRNLSRTFTRSVTTKDNGSFLLENLPKDIYELSVSALGFQRTTFTNISALPGTLTEIDVVLSVGMVQETVTVTSGGSEVLNTSSASVSEVRRLVSVSPNGQSGFTPRVREYFPETLVWSPELITDKKGGASMNFKLADSLTTWKLYAVGSTEKGELGVFEKELRTFQPFFAELDPPKILTEGDEISLPVTVRNYTDKKQKSTVSMTENSWFKLLDGKYRQEIEILPQKSQNAVFNFRAVAPIKDGNQKVTAAAGNKFADAIEKPVTVRPDGFENVENQSRLFNESTKFEVNFPEKAFPNNRQTFLKIYPNLLSHVTDSVEGLLQRPHGCGEQTLSSTYPNLLILKVNDRFKTVDAKTRETALRYLQEGYKRMLNYQTKEGAYSYWGNDPNVQLSAYALRFFNDAEDFIEIDENVREKMQDWLLLQQAKDGSWENSALITAYVLRALSLKDNAEERVKTALQKGLEYLKKTAADSQNSYFLANLALVLQKTGDQKTAESTARKLLKLAEASGETLSWSASETPFYGRGSAAQIETTALVLQVILPYSDEKEFSPAFAGGMRFLIGTKDRYGVWYSTQTTINVLDAFILTHAKIQAKSENEKTEVLVNGKKVKEFAINVKELVAPILLDVSAYLASNANTVEVRGTGASNLTMAQLVATHFSDWKTANLDSRYFDMKIAFDKTDVKIGEEINCSIEIKRKNTNYGMGLAEIGIPPGVDVNRNSLEKLMKDGKINRYDILPDKVVLYYYSSLDAKNFTFKFRPRFGMNAQTPPSMVYDYYNPEEQKTVAPVRFNVK